MKCGCGSTIKPAECGEEWCGKCAWTSREWLNGLSGSLYCRCHRVEVPEDAHCGDWIKDGA